VGSAQWRHEGALLQHGSILLADDQPLIDALLVQPRDSVTPPAATLTAILGAPPTFERVAGALVDALRRTAPSAAALEPDAPLGDDVEREFGHFTADAWTWRR
jgi:lipoate-protein ligase A